MLIFLLLVPFLVLSFYNYPAGDDFWLSALVRESGVIKAQEILYHAVSARYSALTMMSFNPLVFGNFWLFRLIPLVFIILF